MNAKYCIGLTLACGLGLGCMRAEDAPKMETGKPAVATAPAEGVYVPWGQHLDSTSKPMSLPSMAAGDDDGVLVFTELTTGPIDSLHLYYVDADSGTTGAPLAVGQYTSFFGVPHGPHTIQLKSIPADCVVQGENPRVVLVSGPDTNWVKFQVACR